jgi:hypothetical protein
VGVGGAVTADAHMATYIALTIDLYLQSDNNIIFYNANEARPVSPTPMAGQLPVASCCKPNQHIPRDVEILN